MLQTNRQTNQGTENITSFAEVANPCDYKVHHVNLYVSFRSKSHIKFRYATVNIRLAFKFTGKENLLLVVN